MTIWVGSHLGGHLIHVLFRGAQLKAFQSVPKGDYFNTVYDCHSLQSRNSKKRSDKYPKDMMNRRIIHNPRSCEFWWNFNGCLFANWLALSLQTSCRFPSYALLSSLVLSLVVSPNWYIHGEFDVQMRTAKCCAVNYGAPVIVDSIANAHLAIYCLSKRLGKERFRSS